MKKMLLPFLFLMVVFAGCEKTTTLEQSMKNFSEKELEMCQDISCPEVSVNYVVVDGEDERAEKINSTIRSFIIDVLYLGDDELPPQAISVEQAVKDFIRMYRTHNAEFPDMQLEYFAEVQVTDSFMNDELLSLEMRYYLFTGGAHGYGGTKYYNFDIETGEILDIEALFLDITGLESYAEKAFRAAHEIPSEDNINDTGFWFENDSFHLPETIGFSPDTLRLLYNQYEIASYAAGPIELNIPIKEISNFISISTK